MVHYRTVLQGLTAAMLAATISLGTAIALAAEEKPSAQPPAPAKKAAVRLLTVGNSFSADATRHLGPLVKAAGRELVHGSAGIGGGSLAQHWEKAMLHEKDPQDKKGLYGDRSLKQWLQADTWDFVTIQQYSFISHDPATYRPYARNLHDFIKKYAPQAEVLVHQTWAYRADDRRFRKDYKAKPGEPTSQEAMYQGLTRAYETMAADLGARIIPVGDAIYLADTHPTWGFKPDPSLELARFKYPAVPVQPHSLHAGWFWRKSKAGQPTLVMDGHHASVAGQYLAACVFYEMIFGSSAVGNSYLPQGLEADYARFLQETAHQAVQKREQALMRK